MNRYCFDKYERAHVLVIKTPERISKISGKFQRLFVLKSVFKNFSLRSSATQRKTATGFLHLKISFLRPSCFLTSVQTKCYKKINCNLFQSYVLSIQSTVLLHHSLVLRNNT